MYSTKACPFNLGSPFVGVVSVGPVSLGFWPGESGFRGGPCPGLVVFLFLLVILDLNRWRGLTVSPAKRTLPKFMKMASFCLSYLL